MKFCIIKSKRVPADLLTAEDGGSINFIEIINRLKNDKHDITVLTRNEQNPTNYSATRINDITVIFLPFEKSTSKEIMERDFEEGLSFVTSVNKYLTKNDDFDIIHTHHWSSAINLNKSSIKWIHTPHLLAYAKMHHIGYKCPPKIIKAEKHILKKCDKVIALSCSEKNDILTQYDINGNKVTVIPNGIAESFRKNSQPKAIIQENILKLVTVARITKQKRLDTLIKAIDELKRNGIAIHLKIIGGEYSDDIHYNYITELIANLKLQRNIEIVGFINQDEISVIYEQSDLYIQSSYYESQGIAIIEAMSCGLPIITTYQEALEEFFVENENGFYYNGSDYKSMASKIQMIDKDTELYNSISNNNIKKSNDFKWKDTYEKTLEVFDPNYSDKRNQFMLKKALFIGERLTSDHVVSNLAISGSIAKKNTWSGSDIDFVAIKPNSEITEEFLFKDNGIENIYYISETYASQLLKINDLIKLAGYLYKKNIGEYLWNSIPVKKGNDLLNQIVKYVTHVRHTKEYIKALQSIYFNEFQNESVIVRNSLDNSSKYLAVVALRKALFNLTMKFLIGKGWVVQGSKKRPEQLINFCKSNTEKEFYNLFLEINSLSDVSLIDILKITNIRHRLRLKYYNLLVLMYNKNPKNEFLKKEIDHNRSAKNYYLENLRNGFELGALYHLRNLSSFPDFLSRYYFVQNNEKITHIDTLLKSEYLESSIKTAWLQVMDLKNVKTKHWYKELVKFANLI